MCTFAGVFARGVAQLVARYVRDVEAASSSLVTPTSIMSCKSNFCKGEKGDIQEHTKTYSYKNLAMQVSVFQLKNLILCVEKKILSDRT